MAFLCVRRLLAALLALVTVLAVLPAWAADDYTVDNVAAQAVGADPLSARDAALTKAQRDALTSLFTRLAGPGKGPQVTDQLVFQALKGLEVSSEKTTATSYSATLSVTFKRDVIDQMLTNQGISFTAPAGHPALIVPVLIGSDGKAVLWGGDNPWAAAWGQRQPIPGEPLPLTAPMGDLPDIQAISADAAAAMDPNALAALAHNYETDTIIVAVANRSAGGNYTIVANWLGKGVIYQGSSDAASLDGAVAATVQAIQTVYGKVSRVPATPPQSLTAKVAFGSLAEWRRVKTVFETTPAISSVVVKSLAVGEAMVTINFLGDPDSLTKALSSQGVIMSRGPESWILSAGGAGGQLQPLTNP